MLLQQSRTIPWPEVSALGHPRTALPDPLAYLKCHKGLHAETRSHLACDSAAFRVSTQRAYPALSTQRNSYIRSATQSSRGRLPCRRALAAAPPKCGDSSKPRLDAWLPLV